MKTARGTLEVFDSAEIVANAVADLFVERAGEAIGERGQFCVALAGGTTPRAAYALLADEPRSGQIDWRNVAVYFGDERCVPPDDEQSNYRMAQQTLLRRVPIPAENVFRMRGEDDPASAAQDYANVLRSTLGASPRFDLILLGMGTDAHTASLFPGEDPRREEDALVRAPYVEKAGAYRLTLTPAVINNARCIAVAAEGPSKAEALQSVFREPEDLTQRPIQSVAPHDGELRWLVDREAAAGLLQH